MYNKYVKILIANPFKTYKKIKGIFKSLTSHIFLGKFSNIPLTYIPNKGKIFSIFSYDLQWKDKYDSPRFEESPYIVITLFKWCIAIIYYPPTHLEKENYWEQALWYLYYYGNYSYGRLSEPNLKAAKKSWPWQDMKGNSTWDDNCLTIKGRKEL